MLPLGPQSRSGAHLWRASPVHDTRRQHAQCVANDATRRTVHGRHAVVEIQEIEIASSENRRKFPHILIEIIRMRRRYGMP